MNGTAHRRGVDFYEEAAMDHRLEALLGLVSVAIMFVPILVVFAAVPAGEQIRAARKRRTAAYRNSPESRLLILNS
jgi:hypothetical protein